MISPFCDDLDRVAGGVLDVADRLEHQEQRVVVAVHLRSLVGVHRVLDGQFVQAEQLGDDGHLVGVGLVQADPDEAAALGADPGDRRDRVVALGHPIAVDVGGAVDDGLGVRRPGAASAGAGRCR